MDRREQILRDLERVAMMCAELGWTGRAKRIDDMIMEIDPTWRQHERA